MAYFESLFKLKRPEDLREYSASLKAMLREPGRLWALGQFGRGSKEPCFKVRKLLLPDG